MDLNNVVNEKLKEAVDNGTVAKIIEARVNKLLTDVIDEALSSYGDIAKEIKAFVKEKVKIDLSHTDVNEYNHNISVLTSRILNEKLLSYGMEKCEASLNKMLSTEMPKDMSLEELVERFKGDNYEEEGEISFHYELSHGLVSVYLDEDEDTRAAACKYRFFIDKDDMLSTIYIDDKKLKDQFILGNMYDFDKLLFQIYSAGTKITHSQDMADEIDTYFGRDDD